MVLVVDDQPEVRTLARVVLEVSGHLVRVVEAADGPAAVAAAQRERPDLAVVDHRMPGQDGLSVVADLVALHPGMAVALCSAALDSRLTSDGTPPGVRWLVPKHELVRLPELVDELIEAGIIAARPSAGGEQPESIPSEPGRPTDPGRATAGAARIGTSAGTGRDQPVGLPPAGRVLEIVAGDQRAVVTESGATLRAYTVGRRPVIEAFDGPEAVVVGSQGEILAPWPNRVVDGRWTWQGEEQQLSITEPDRGHALHGLVRTLTWSVVEHRADFVELDVLLLAHPGWPFPLHCAVTYALRPDGLTSTLTATNVGRRPCPYGAAVHSYLAVAGRVVDDAVLHLPAATWLATDGRLSPTTRQATAGTEYDFSDGTPIGSRQADTAFTDLPRAADGRVEASLTTPDGHRTVLWGDESVRWWQLFTGDALADPWRRTTLAVEPMTCAPNALNTGEDLVVLEPGERHTLTWGITSSS